MNASFTNEETSKCDKLYEVIGKKTQCIISIIIINDMILFLVFEYVTNIYISIPFAKVIHIIYVTQYIYFYDSCTPVALNSSESEILLRE